MTDAQRLIYLEDGIHWAWFTEMKLDGDRASVEILSHYRLHWDEYGHWPRHCKEAEKHPMYYGTQRWRKDDQGVSTHYYVPLDEMGWLPISNPRSVFDYDMNQ